jgi:hypothetical protein
MTSDVPLDWSPLFRALSELVRAQGGKYRVLELWLDTSVAKAAPDRSAPSLHVVAHAFNPFGDLDAAFAKVAETQDIGFLEDEHHEVSDQLWFELTHVHPDLSTGDGFFARDGGAQLTRALSALVARDDQLAAFSKVFWYWVGTCDFVWIKRER